MGPKNVSHCGMTQGLLETTVFDFQPAAHLLHAFACEPSYLEDGRLNAAYAVLENTFLSDTIDM